MSRDQETLATKLFRAARGICSWLVSSKATVSLLLALAAVLTAGVLLEARNGSEYADWFVYESVWFLGFFVLLGLSSLCALGSCLPWKRRHVGFVTTHAGLL